MAAGRGGRSGAQLSPVLLIGAGTGEATCGILYVASYLRRHGVDAVVRLTDDDETDAAVSRSVERLLARVRPKLVGVSLKWFHHVARARTIARAIKRAAPEVTVALGGNSATLWWKELLGWDCVDHVVLGDGEAPLLALCRGVSNPPNVVSAGALPVSRPALRYVQSARSGDVHYSHFCELFLSEEDLASFSGWVAPGKGCGENCLYCGGTRGLQKATFGRATPFLRDVERVRKDHAEVAPHTWQLRYDFAGSSAAFLRDCWQGVDLSRHACTYFLWGAPKPGLMEALADTFARVFMVLDVGCFSQTQRLAMLEKGLLKPCPTDDELRQVVRAARRFPSLALEVSAIAGLPFATAQTLAEERALVDELLGAGCTVGYQRLESQPGALVTEHPARFGMVSEASSFESFVDYFTRVDASGRTVPMVRYADAAFEGQVEDTFREVSERIWAAADRRGADAVKASSRLQRTAHVSTTTVGAWLGTHRAPAKVRAAPLTVARGVDGAGLALAPTLTQAVRDARVEVGADARAVLAALEAFEAPARVEDAVAALRHEARLGAGEARELIRHLVDARLLGPTRR